LSVIDDIRARYETIGLFPIEVPEWSATLYFNVIPSAVVDSVTKGLRTDQEFEKYVRLIVATARDADGAKVFAIGDRADLMRKAEPRVITRIAEEALNYDPPDNSPEA